MAVLCVISSAGVAAYFCPIWRAARSHRDAAGSQAEGMLSNEELVGGDTEDAGR